MREDFKKLNDQDAGTGIGIGLSMRAEHDGTPLSTGPVGLIRKSAVQAGNCPPAGREHRVMIKE
jgi:hypothetical protein